MHLLVQNSFDKRQVISNRRRLRSKQKLFKLELNEIESSNYSLSEIALFVPRDCFSAQKILWILPRQKNDLNVDLMFKMTNSHS